MNIGYGAYDNFAGLSTKEVAKLVQKNTSVVPVVPVPLVSQNRNPQLDGWASDTANKVGMSLWDYFRPMLPWFIVSNLITGIVIWKVASLFCSGRMAWGTAKRGLKSGMQSVTGAVGGIGRGIGRAAKGAKSKVGLKKKR